MHAYRGKHSTVYVRGDRAIKVFKEGLSYNFWKEVSFLSYLQPWKFVPKLYSIDPEKLSVEMEFIKGKNLRELRKSCKLEADLLISCLDVCRTLDKLLIQKEEMNNPEKHVIFVKNKPYFIDFERAVITSKPSNVTQFISYILKVTNLNFSDIVLEVRNYRMRFDDESYSMLREKIIDKIF